MDKYCALYSRVSDEIQVQRGESIPRQKSMLEDEAKSLGFARYRHFVDEGISGKDTNRPAFQDMVKEIEAGHVSYVLVYDLARVSRKELDTFKFFELLDKARITFKAVRGNFDISTPEGRMMMGMTAVSNSYFRADLIRKVKDAMVKIHKDGRFTGGQPAYGFSVKDKKLIHCPDEAAVVRKMFDKFEDVKSFHGVTTWLNRKGYRTKKSKEFPAQTVRRILTNSLYCGLQTFGKRPGYCDTKIQPKDKWLISKGNFEPIISTEQFDRVQTIIQARGYKAHPKGKHIHLLNGILYCGHCGEKMHGSLHKQRTKEHFYYRCSAKAQRGTCAAVNIRGYELEDKVLEKVRERVHLHFSNEEVDAIDVQSDWQGELIRIDKAIASCNVKESNLIEFIADGKRSSDAIAVKMDKIAAERAALEVSRAEILAQNNTDALEARKKVYENVAKLNGDISSVPRAKLYVILREIVAQITARRDEIQVDMYEVESV